MLAASLWPMGKIPFFTNDTGGFYIGKTNFPNEGP